MPVWYLAIGVVTLCAYALDKLAAERRGWRVSEARLQMLALAGGWPIAWVAQQLFRHKTRKHEFRKVFRFCVAANLIVLGAVIWVGGDPINLVKELASHLQKQGLQAEGM